MLTDFTMKDTFYNVEQVLRVDTVLKYAEYYSKVDGVMRKPQMVDFNEVATVKKAEYWMKKSPSSYYATKIEYLYAFRNVA